MTLLWLITIPIFLAFIGYFLEKKTVMAFIIVVQGCLVGLSTYTFSFIYQQGTQMLTLGYDQSFLGITLIGDRISLLFVTLTCFLFFVLLIFNYHKHYMTTLFVFLFLLLEAQIITIFLSDDLFNLYALIEVSTITVAVLIMFKKDSHSIYDGILYLLTNLVSMTFFLLGVGFVYKIFGTLSLTEVGKAVPLVTTSETLILPYVLLVTAIGLKSAVMPLFSWLPRAHGTPSAPSIVSAILSGLYVKGGVYLFIRFQSAFSSQIDTTTVFAILGFLTAIIGLIFAISQTDIKLILAYSTVSQIGLVIFGLSLNTEYSYYGSIYHILNHAVFKSTLFLTAGIIIEAYDTRDIRKIRGLFKTMPFVSIVMIIAILGITGAPFFNGSISKYLIQKGTHYYDYLEYGMFFINAGTIAYFFKYAQMFVGEKKDGKVIRWNQKITIALLAAITFIGGFFGQKIVLFLFDLHVSIDVAAIKNKLIVYVITIIIGYLFYKFVYLRLRFFRTIREIELNFNEIVFSIVIFFAGFLTLMMMTYT